MSDKVEVTEQMLRRIVELAREADELASIASMRAMRGNDESANRALDEMSERLRRIKWRCQRVLGEEEDDG